MIIQRILALLAFAPFLDASDARAAEVPAVRAAVSVETAKPTWHRLTVTNSWFANSHADARFMPQGIEGMYVTPDGTTYTNIRWEEGGGNVVEVKADGTVQPRPGMPGGLDGCVRMPQRAPPREWRIPNH